MDETTIRDDEFVSRYKIMKAYRLAWADVEPLLAGAGVKPAPLSPERKQPRFLGSAVKAALEKVSHG